MIGLQLAIVLLLIVLNGLLAMSELAIVSARTGRLEQRAAEGARGARTALDLADDPNQFLSTVQIGITLIGIINGVFGGATLSGPFADLLAKIPILEPYARTVSSVMVILTITYLSLIVGELVPKQLALQRTEEVASLMAPSMKLLAKVAAPVVWFLSVSSDFVLRLLRADQYDEPSVTEQEVKLLLKQATDAGVFERAEQEMVTKVFRLGDRNVGELMTPSHAIIFLDPTDPESVTASRMQSSRFEMYPVCEGSTDNVVGVVSARDLWQSHLSGSSTAIGDVMQPALFVPEFSPVLLILQQMRDSETSMAIVIDEYGGVEGLLTLTDIVEVLVDDISAVRGQDVGGATRRDDGTWLVDGVFPAHDLRELFDIDHLEGEAHGHFETVGGFIMNQLGYIPVAGEHVTVEGHRIEVVDMDGHRIDKVLITPLDRDDYKEGIDAFSEDT